MKTEDLFKPHQEKQVKSTYIRVHREVFSHLIPARICKGEKGTPFFTKNTFEEIKFALPLSQPMALVSVSTSDTKGKDGYVYGAMFLGKALEIGHKSNEEWIAELCPQYTGFPIYETFERPELEGEA